MADCQISKDILYNCETPPIAGQENEIIVIPMRILDSYTENGSNHLIVEDITIAAGGNRAYQYKGDSKLIATDKGLIRDEFADGYRHRLPFKIHDNKPDTKLELQSLRAERHCVIVKNLYKGTAGNAKWEIFGIDVGMEVAISEDTEGKNSYNIEFVTPEATKEPHLPRNFYKTSEAATDALVEALLVATSP